MLGHIHTETGEEVLKRYCKPLIMEYLRILNKKVNYARGHCPLGDGIRPSLDARHFGTLQLIECP